MPVTSEETSELNCDSYSSYTGLQDGDTTPLECREMGVNEAIDGAGCGFGSLLYCAGPALYLCLQGSDMIVLSVVGLMSKCEWDLTPFWISTLQFGTLACTGLAAITTSTLGDKLIKSKPS